MIDRLERLKRKVECLRVIWQRLAASEDVYNSPLITDHNAVEEAEVAYIDAQLQLDEEAKKPTGEICG